MLGARTPRSLENSDDARAFLQTRVALFWKVMCCFMAVASLLGPARPLNADQLALAQRPREPLPEMDPGPAATDEKELRRQVAEFVRRGCRQRLMTSTEGTFSARLDAQATSVTSVASSTVATAAYAALRSSDSRLRACR